MQIKIKGEITKEKMEWAQGSEYLNDDENLGEPESVEEVEIEWIFEDD